MQEKALDIVRDFKEHSAEYHLPFGAQTLACLEKILIEKDEKDKNGKTTQINNCTIYRDGYKTTHTGYQMVNEKWQWTSALRENDDGSRVKYLRTYHTDGSYYWSDERYDENNKLTAKNLIDYDSKGKEQTSLRWEDGDNRYHCRIYTYDEQGNVLYRPRISYNIDDYNNYVNNADNGKDAFTVAYEKFLQDVNSTSVNLSDAVAIFDNGIGNDIKPVEVKVYDYRNVKEGVNANITEKKSDGTVITADYHITDKDDKGYYQWVYEWGNKKSDGTTERWTEYWNYNSSGSRESVTIYNSNGLHITMYNSFGKRTCKLNNLDPNKYELKEGNILYFNGSPLKGRIGNFCFENGKIKL